MYKEGTTRVHCYLGAVCLLLARSTKKPLNQVANRCLTEYLMDVQHMRIDELPQQLLIRTDRDGTLHQGGEHKQLRIKSNLVNYVRLNRLNMSACIEAAILKYYLIMMPNPDGAAIKPKPR